MNLRQKNTNKSCHSDSFNTHSGSEIIVYFDDDCDSLPIKDFEIELGVGDSVYWKDLNKAIEDHDIITDNYNTRFFEPRTEEDKKRGYSLE